MSAARARVVRHWASFLGVSPEGFEVPGVRAIAPARAGLADYPGVWALRCGEAAWVSLPPGLPASLGERLAGLTAAEVVTPAAMAAVLGERVARAIGPAWQGWLPPGGFAPTRHPGARSLGPGDRPALEGLRRACSAEEWDHAGLAPDAPNLAGVFEADGALAAAAHLREGPGGAIDPGVLCHPARRGRGLGAAAVSAALAPVLPRAAPVLYQTLLANGPALGVARRLGFRPFATTLALRLHAG